MVEERWKDGDEAHGFDNHLEEDEVEEDKDKGNLIVFTVFK